MGPTWCPSGADMAQVGPMLAPWILLSGLCWSSTYIRYVDTSPHATEIVPKRQFQWLCLHISGTGQLTTRLTWTCVHFYICVHFESRPGSSDIHICRFTFDALAQGSALYHMYGCWFRWNTNGHWTGLLTWWVLCVRTKRQVPITNLTNNRMFPIAYIVVTKPNTAVGLTWVVFFHTNAACSGCGSHVWACDLRWSLNRCRSL